MKMTFRIACVAFIAGAVIYLVLDRGSLGAWLTLIGALFGLWSSYDGVKEGSVAIRLHAGRPSHFEISNPGTVPIRDVEIALPNELKALRRDFDDLPKTLLPRTPPHVILVGLEGLGATPRFVFQAYWRCGLLTKKSRRIEVKPS